MLSTETTLDILFSIPRTYNKREILVGSGSKLSHYLQLSPLFTFGDPALDEDNKIDESDNDEISAKPEALNTLCGLVCVPQGVPHILEVPFDLIHDLNLDPKATLEAVERDEEYKQTKVTTMGFLPNLTISTHIYGLHLILLYRRKPRRPRGQL